MFSLLDEDILRVLAEFLQPLDLFQTFKMGRKILEWRFPTAIYLSNIQQIRQFEQWCQLYDTSRLVKVNMSTSLFDDDDFEVFGWVPPSVKSLIISNNAGCHLIIPEGIESISIGRCRLFDLIIPNSVRDITLTHQFDGSVRFPDNLHSLTVLNWGYDDPNQEPDQYLTIYRDLPQTIREIYIGSEIPLTFSEWPNQLSKLTIQKIQNIDNIEYPLVPETVEYTEIWEYNYYNDYYNDYY